MRRGMNSRFEQSNERLRGAAWQRLREAVLDANPYCTRCQELNVLRLAREVDHIVPLFKGGSNEISNLHGLCSPHHVDKTADDMGWRKRTRVGVDGWPVEGE